MPDAGGGNKIYLIKNVGEMRLTYQIKMLAFMASEQSRKLIVQIPKQATIHASLREFVKNSEGRVKVERGK